MHKLSEITPNIIIRDTPKLWAIGLMFHKKLQDTSFLFVFPEPRKVPIHMLFVFQSIDAVWVNDELEIIDIKRNIPPFIPAVYHKGRAKYLIEMPSGKSEGLKLMDVIDVT